MKIGEKLKENRTAAGLSQEALSERIGVSRQTISSWENDRSYPDIGSILKLSDLYSLSLDELLKEDEGMRKHVERSAVLTDKLWNSLLVTAILLMPLSMLLFHWQLNVLGVAAKVVSMVLMLAVLIVRWRLSGDSKWTMAIGVLFWGVLYIPDLIGWIAYGATDSTAGFEYIFLGIMLFYSYGEIFKTKLAFWQTIAIYLGVPIFIGISIMLPQIREEGLFRSDDDPFGYSYRVDQVWYGEGEPLWVELEGDGKGLSIDGQFVGEFQMQEPEEGSSYRQWHLIPEGYRSNLIVMDSSIGTDTVQLERRTYGTNPDGSEYSDTLWSIQLERLPAINRVVRTTGGTVRGSFTIMTDWYPDTADKTPEDFWHAYNLGESDVVSFSAKDRDISEITVIVEYHAGDRMESMEYFLTRGTNGEFNLPEEIYSLPRAEGAFFFIRIPWEDGAYLTRLNYE